MGLFAHLSWILLGLDWASRHGYTLHFRCTNPQYNLPGRADDWLNQIVQQPPVAARKEFRITEYSEFPFARLSLGEGRSRVRALSQSQLQLRTELTAHCERWLAEHINNSFVIGIHYRGSDKSTEAPRLPYETAINTLNRIIALLAASGINPIKVFVATDEQDFLKAARLEIRGAQIHTVENNLRAQGSTAVHNQGSHDGHRLAHEAMIDALLLSRTNLLVKTASALSGWAALLGNEMPVLFLSQPYASTAYYPDGILVGESYAIGQEQAVVQAAVTAFRQPTPARQNAH
jgi:hypothetical protein